MSRRACCAAAFICVLSGILLAEPGVVVTKDGTTYEGDVREDDQNVIITIRGIETVVPRSNIGSLKYSAKQDEEFRQRLAKLEANDVKGRIALARQAFNRRRYDLAREAINDALRIDPNNRDATEFADLVERQIRLERAAGAAPVPPAAPRPAAPRGSAPQRALLSADDINLIRQKELRSSDNGVRITFQSDVKKRFAERENIPFADFNRLPPAQQAIDIIDHGDESMRRQVRITTDPSSLAEFKRAVQPVVLSHCATSGCHGGAAGGNFTLHGAADSDAVSYTNFYILTQYQRAAQGPGTGGVFSSSARRMIERGHGELSLLANYGLPVNIAEYDHPDVGSKPVQPTFRNKQDPRYEQIVSWMDKTLAPVSPDYGISFTIPAPATEPASRPAR